MRNWELHVFSNFQFSIFNCSVVTLGTELKPTHPRSRPLTSMPKNQIEPTAEVRSGVFARWRLRRIRMIVELTLNLISSDMTVSYREARSLVACARKAILALYPAFSSRYA